MTTFEEELSSLPVSESTKYTEYWNKAQLLTVFKDWQPDEEFQTKENELKRLQKLNHLYKKAKGNVERMAVDRGERLNQAQDEIAYLKSQLQQQSLPVVPEFVAEWYEDKKNKLEFAVYNINTLVDKKSFNDLTKIEKWFEGVENKPIETIFKMKDGYTVEKPQLFYLREKNTGYYLRKTGNSEYGITVHYSNDYDENYMHYKFTQQEIDSMETGSYEKIEVTE